MKKKRKPTQRKPRPRPVHVVFDKLMRRWYCRREGGRRITPPRVKKGDAQREGRRIAKHERAEFVIHNRDGTIADSDSYGNDPARSRDRVH